MSSYQHEFQAIGTGWQITSKEALTSPALARMQRTIDKFDFSYSRFRPDSDVSRLSQSAGSQEFPDNAGGLLAFYRDLYDITGGKVSPLVGRALEHLGYDADYSLQRRPGRAHVPRWDDVLTVTGSTVTTAEPVLLDLGAAGKGYLVDLLVEDLIESGCDEFLINASGDIAAVGSEITRVGLEHPGEPGQVIGVANLSSASLCGSAINRRAWGKGLHHVIDPDTGEPTSGVLATWVLTDRKVTTNSTTVNNTMVADGLATALFFTEPAVLADHFQFSYVRMLASGGVEYSTNFDGELFT